MVTAEQLLKRSTRAICGALEREVVVRPRNLAIAKAALRRRGLRIVGTSEEKDKIAVDIKAQKDEIKRIGTAPRAFEARAAHRSLINEEKTKIKDITNSDELSLLFTDAKCKKDKYRMAVGA